MLLPLSSHPDHAPYRGGARCDRDLPLRPSLSCPPGRSHRTPEVGVWLGRRQRVLESPTLSCGNKRREKTTKQNKKQPLHDLEKATLFLPLHKQELLYLLSSQEPRED